jgi:uracil-DNA glycosylase
MSTQKQHPIEYLFNERKEIALDRYEKVVPVPEMIRQTAFFPGGSGLWLGESGLLGAPANWPPMPKEKVMVLGNDFGQKWWHEKCLRANARDWKSKTWMHLRLLLQDAGIQPEDCFFTNAYMGLRSTGKSTGPSPGMVDPKFVERCQLFFLDKQLPMQKPRLILVLGAEARKFIAQLSADLAEWKDCKTFSALDDSDLGPVVNKVCFNKSKPITVVALVHPAGRNMGNVLKDRRYRKAKGAAAELKMLKKALKKSGLR